MANEATQVAPPEHSRLRAKMEGKPQVQAEPIAQADAAPVVAAPVAKVEPVVAAPAAAPVKPEIETAPVKPNYDEMSDEDITALLEKRTGRKLKSLDDLKEPAKAPTAEEKADLEAREKAESLEWALGTNKITRDLYDQSVVERSKDKRSIALALFTKELQEDDKDLSAEECEQKFMDYYAEEEDEKSWRRKKATKEMNAVADNYLAQFNVVDNLPEEYRSFKTSTEALKNFGTQIRAAAKEVPENITYKIPYTSGTGETLEFEYNIPVDQKILATITKELHNPATMEYFSQSKPEAIAKEINFLVKARMQEAIIPVLLEQHGEKVAEDMLMSLKNARNPQQPLTGAFMPSGAAKTPPPHTRTRSKVK